MKKILTALLAAAMVLSICGCANLKNLKNVEVPELPKQENTAETPEPEASAEPETAAVPEGPSKVVTVTFSDTEESFLDPAKNEKLILTFKDSVPKVSIPEDPDRADMINEYLMMLDETFVTGNDFGAGAAPGKDLMYQYAIDNFTYAYETGDESIQLDLAASRSVTAKRCDDTVISFLYNDFIYAGAAMEEFQHKAYNFNAKTGELLTIEDIFSDYEAARILITNYVASYANITEEAAAAAFTDTRWYMNPDGIVFLAIDEEDNLNAIEKVSFLLSYDTISSMMKDEFLPRVHETTGSIRAEDLNHYQETNVEIEDFLSVKAGGQNVLVIADGPVYNLRIAKAEYSNAAHEFMISEELYARSILSDAALQIQCELPEGLPDLMVLYFDAAGAEHRLCLTSDGENGNICLTPAEEISAVG